MRERVEADEEFVAPRSVNEALERFLAEGQDYKVELIEDLVRDRVDHVSLYTNGPFTELCRGPHAPSTKRMARSSCSRSPAPSGAATPTARCSARVYGTAFFDKKALAAELERLEQARARNARKLGRELGLFTFSFVAGSAFWLPKGTVIWNELVALSREMGTARGFTEVKTPQLYDSELWKTSGHWGKYHSNMFITETETSCRTR